MERPDVAGGFGSVTWGDNSGEVPGEFGGTHMAFFCPWDGWQISGVQPLSGDASVLVELDFDHGGDEGRNGTGKGAGLAGLSMPC